MKHFSDCCNAPVVVGGIGDFHDNDHAITQYHQCKACSNPCSIRQDKDDYLAELVRDLTSVEVRTKSGTRKILEQYSLYEHSYSEWKRIGKERHYFEFLLEQGLQI
jgi:hypothetical protein